MLEIKNATACPPSNFFFFYAVSASVPVQGDLWPSKLQVMIGVGGAETGNRQTDITYSAMPRFIAVAPRADWRFNMKHYPKFGLASLIAGDFTTGWRIDGMVDKTAMWRAWRSHDEPALAQQLGVTLKALTKLPPCVDFEDFTNKVIIPLMPRRKQIIQAAWNSLKTMPNDHWRGEYKDVHKWRTIQGPNELSYHNWNTYPVWEKEGGILWKKSRKLISLEGKFLCGPTIRSLNREVMRVVEQLEEGKFGG